VGINVHSFVFILKYLSGSGGIGICECDSVSNYKKEVDMGKREDYEAKTEQLIAPIIAANHVELFDVDYIKEGQDWYLRVYIDKEGGVTIDDCQAVSRAFNEVLDKENYIADQYIFEVSSPGLTRPLKKEKDYEKSIGRLLDIKLYKPVEGKKEYAGILKEYNKDIIIIESDDTQITIERSNLAMIRWAYVD
jgi:ribosome maturation factor RimP